MEPIKLKIISTVMFCKDSMGGDGFFNSSKLTDYKYLQDVMS